MFGVISGGPVPAVREALAASEAKEAARASKAANILHGQNFAANFEADPDPASLPDRAALGADSKIWSLKVMRRLAAAVGLSAGGLKRDDLIDVLSVAREAAAPALEEDGSMFPEDVHGGAEDTLDESPPHMRRALMEDLWGTDDAEEEDAEAEALVVTMKEDARVAREARIKEAGAATAAIARQKKKKAAEKKAAEKAAKEAAEALKAAGDRYDK